jgi:hypothetical protein
MNAMILFNHTITETAALGWPVRAPAPKGVGARCPQEPMARPLNRRFRRLPTRRPDEKFVAGVRFDMTAEDVVACSQLNRRSSSNRAHKNGDDDDNQRMGVEEDADVIAHAAA